MKIFLIIFILQVFVSINCDEFVTVWAPKESIANKDYNIFYYASELTKPTEISIQYRKAAATTYLENDEHKRLEFSNKNPGQTSKLTVTLFRNISDTRKECLTHEQNITTERQNFFIFIQLDKPIYKPGDELKSRIIVVDRNLMPFQMNNIEINITDPVNNIIYSSHNDLKDKPLGVVEVKYKVSDFALIGDWTIHAVVDKKKQWTQHKVFSIQKYVLPLFDVVIDLPETHFLHGSSIAFSFFGRYSFGDFVSGSADLIIRNAKNKDIVYKAQKFENIERIQDVTYNTILDLKLPLNKTGTELEIYVEFNEPESGLTFNKSRNIFINNDEKYRLVVKHPEKYLPNIPFGVKVFVYDWRNNQIINHFESVILEYSYILNNNRTETMIIKGRLEDGVVAYDFMPLENFVRFEIKVKFVNCNPYQRTIERGMAEVFAQELKIGHLPLIPKINKPVEIYIKGTEKMDSVLMVVMSKQGNLKSNRIQCKGTDFCKFELKITEDMMPQSTVVVYHIVNKRQINQGQIILNTDALGSNELTMTLSTQKTKSKTKVGMTFATEVDSKVYVLAFDKRLKYLRDGNDVTKDDVKGTFASYDDNNHVIVLDASQNKLWHKCTAVELDRVEKHRVALYQQAGSYRPKGNDDEDAVDDSEGDNNGGFKESEPAINPDDANDDFMRENFPESWIFDSFDMNVTSFQKQYAVPDTMTTWLISAFAIKKDHRLAIAPTQELIVKNDFFFKVKLPYSIRFMEVLRLDIMVFNYLPSRETLNVKVDLENLNKITATNEIKQFENVEYANNGISCNLTTNTNSIVTKTVNVPYMSVKRVSFYIRTNPHDKEFQMKVQKKILLQIRATANSSIGKHVDAVRRNLLVEPVGISVYEVNSTDYHLSSETFSQSKFFGTTEQWNAEDENRYPRANVIITGDYLSDMTTLPERFHFYPNQCSQQRVSMMKGNIEYIRYAKAKGLDIVNSVGFEIDAYQAMTKNDNAAPQNRNIWSYSYDASYRAYLMDVFVTATELKILADNTVNQEFLKTQLSFIATRQSTNGNFAFDTFLTGIMQSISNVYVRTYYSTAYNIIPFLKLRKLNTPISNSYEDVITKCFEYLEDDRNQLSLSNGDLSIAAYAFALMGKKDKANETLQTIEKAKIFYDDRKMCFKLNKNDFSCDLIHTVYAALAKMELGLYDEAAPLINWILPIYHIGYHSYNTYKTAISSEAIAKMAAHLVRYRNTNLDINVWNEYGYHKNFKITKSNSSQPLTIEFPQYTRNVTYSITGDGYCSVSTVFESKVFTESADQSFVVDVNTNVPGYTENNSKVIEVCATKIDAKKVLQNVIYEVEMPSGYVFVKMVNMEAMNDDIKKIEKKRKDTLVILYFDQFETNKKYCARIMMKRMFIVRNLQSAGIKVYDYNNKNSYTAHFYDLTSKCQATDNTQVKKTEDADLFFQKLKKFNFELIEKIF